MSGARPAWEPPEDAEELCHQPDESWRGDVHLEADLERAFAEQREREQRADEAGDDAG
jgi:hypothetical protein